MRFSIYSLDGEVAAKLDVSDGTPVPNVGHKLLLAYSDLGDRPWRVVNVTHDWRPRDDEAPILIQVERAIKRPAPAKDS